jgi:exodeoxyribonuclease-3
VVSVKVATWNVNGIRARAAQVKEWMDREQPDVVCLQELKAELAQVPEVVLRPDYHAFWHCCKGY